MKPPARVYVAGGDTLLGAALLKAVAARGCELVGLPGDEPDHSSAAQVEDFFAEYRPDTVFVAAGKSGGIGLNQTQPVDLMLDNLRAVSTLIPAAHTYGARKLLYLASSCCYPRLAPQPMLVGALHGGPLEPTSAAYATAKLAGLQLCAAYRQQYGVDFRCAIAANAFGPGDDFGEQSGHIIPALLRRLHDAKQGELPEVAIWGSGKARREFVYAKDIADAALFVMSQSDAPLINLGGGEDVSVAEIARLLAQVVGYRGRLVFDTSKPDGMPLKRLDSGPLLATGWRPRYRLTNALTETYTWFLQHVVKEDPANGTATVSVALSDSPR